MLSELYELSQKKTSGSQGNKVYIGFFTWHCQLTVWLVCYIRGVYYICLQHFLCLYSVTGYLHELLNTLRSNKACHDKSQSQVPCPPGAALVDFRMRDQSPRVHQLHLVHRAFSRSDAHPVHPVMHIRCITSCLRSCAYVCS